VVERVDQTPRALSAMERRIFSASLRLVIVRCGDAAWCRQHSYASASGHKTVPRSDLQRVR